MFNNDYQMGGAIREKYIMMMFCLQMGGAICTGTKANAIVGHEVPVSSPFKFLTVEHKNRFGNSAALMT